MKAPHKRITFFNGPYHQKLKKSAADGISLLLICVTILLCRYMLSLVASKELVNFSIKMDRHQLLTYLGPELESIVELSDVRYR
jgi:hypothetical protein